MHRISQFTRVFPFVSLKEAVLHEPREWNAAPAAETKHTFVGQPMHACSSIYEALDWTGANMGYP